MRHCSRVVLAVAAWAAGAGPAAAQRQASAGVCPNESAQISINFNGMDKDVLVVKTTLDAKIAEVKSLAAEQHFTKFDLQSYNYNISPNYNGGEETQYQYNGNAGFSVLPADRAVEFMALLVKKGYRTSVSVSSYTTANCSPGVVK